MFCFCYNELVDNLLDFGEIDFTEFGDPNAEKTCDRFLGYFRIIQLYTSLPAAMI
jgi:hypothetical protein